MEVTVRQATRDDVEEMHRIRMAVRENRLVTIRISPEDYSREMEVEGRGWVAEAEGAIVGFAVGNATTGNVWGLFVEPAHERGGVGRRLHDVMVSWLFDQGLHRLWLTTEANTRASRFYEAAGWRDAGRTEGDETRYELQRSAE